MGSGLVAVIWLSEVTHDGSVDPISDDSTAATRAPSRAACESWLFV